MRIFVTGSKGQLGRDSLDVFASLAEVAGLDLPDLDIADAGAVERTLSAFKPDAVINAAAYTQVDRAETDREAARRANADGPRVLAEYVERHGGLLVHVSTDYVFDGRRPPPRPYVETDPTGPASVYGRTKLEGEEAVRRATERHLILRTAWLYGASSRGFLRAILGRAVSNPGAPLRVVNDQFGSPTWSWRLARQIRKALEGGARGLYHAAGEGACTWFDFAAEFLRLLNVPARVEPCPATEYPRPAPRPRNSVLENARLKAEGLQVMRPWAEDLAEFARLHGERWLREAREAKA
ncbi:MAG TPA: dTDP-4-dehydrorhamnose reductase [Kiritimatiellia bacterium]|nr:dTDP-4-dehydrorhamnose reductase [Kiritimatiellia bacterium]HRZ12109.1 dTDP-4-dehydrorhamnose reductase [Kiritimatiellia bacterium]HSA18133.1 dTDP-4-dehydrorhamnose reductase [Kiritimatiellia bacterium]